MTKKSGRGFTQSTHRSVVDEINVSTASPVRWVIPSGRGANQELLWSVLDQPAHRLKKKKNVCVCVCVCVCVENKGYIFIAAYFA